MPAPIISVENLSKRYLLGHRAERSGPDQYAALRDIIGREIRNAARKAGDVVRGRQVVQGDAIEEFWALKDVSFEVQQGEVLGIIGRNGAGKSTILKILSRITEPTAGRVTLRGRVASLLEVGTGFHPELSGRENIYLNGAILGMRHAEIRKKFDEIVAFAEVEKFLDTPVKRYSSGMYVRLAFAVAAHLEPEILIVDEVLAVGDAEFQRKCLGKMDDVSRREGRTVLVVSHNMGVITSLCVKALWLDRGAVHEQGAPRVVVGRYLARSVQSQDRVIRLDSSQRDPFIQDDRLRFTAVEWLSPLPLQNGEPVKLRLHFEARAAVAGISVDLGFNSIEGARVLTYHIGLHDGPRRDLARPGKYAVDLAIDALSLGPDLYNLDIVCRSGDFHFLDSVPGCVQLEVMAGPTTPAAIAQRHPGVRLEGNWSWARAEQPSEPELVLEARERESRGAKGLSGVARQKLSDRYNPAPGFGDVLFGDVGDPAAVQPGGDGLAGVQDTAGAAPLFIAGAGRLGTTLIPGIEHYLLAAVARLGIDEKDTASMLQKLRGRSFRSLKALHRFPYNASQTKTVIFVTGSHRSGTNMVMEMLDRSWATKVFHEADDSMFDQYIMREDVTVRRLVKHSTASIVVIKALHEAHMLSQLLDCYHPAKAVWIIRDFDAVINSMIQHWPGFKNKIDELVEDRSAADWRGMGMTDETHKIVKSYYKPEMSDAAASALFWYYRNQLLFDQKLVGDKRILIVKYEDLVTQPHNYGRRLSNFLDIKLTTSMRELPRASHVLAQHPAFLPDDLRVLCEKMQVRLSRAYSQNLSD